MIAHIPHWVFAVLALLLALGLMQARTRLVAPALIRAVAFGLLAYSLWGVVGSFGLHAAVVTAWLAGIGVSAVPGRSAFAPRGMSFDAATSKVRVPGSWLPLVLLMGIFGLKFGVGYAAGSGSPIAAGSPDDVEPMAREGHTWLMTMTADGLPPLAGAAPLLIQRASAIHPASRLPDRGLRLRRLRIRHPDPVTLARLLARIGLDGDARIGVEPAAACALAAEIEDARRTEDDGPGLSRARPVQRPGPRRGPAAYGASSSSTDAVATTRDAMPASSASSVTSASACRRVSARYSATKVSGQPSCSAMSQATRCSTLSPSSRMSSLRRWSRPCIASLRVSSPRCTWPNSRASTCERSSVGARSWWRAGTTAPRRARASAVAGSIT